MIKSRTIILTLLFSAMITKAAFAQNEKLLVGFEREEVKKWITFCIEPKGRLIDGKPKRVKVVYFNENIEKKLLKKLEYLHGLYKTQNELG